MGTKPAAPTDILFDLDDTLYPHASGVWQAIGERIDQFMVERCAIPPDQVVRLRAEYFHSFGTTLNGLRLHYGIDPFEYLRYVHDIPLECYLQPDARLDQMVSQLPQRKTIFSNSDESHTRRVLRQLGIERHFDLVIDIVALGFVNKPNPAAYRTALRLLGSPSPRQCVLVDDQVRNLTPAKDLGLITVLVGRGEPGEGVDFRIDHILDLAAQVPVLGA
ncbi:MAG: pyrimidine 5'-nucleotidase [Anaerolineales bacterium]|jgi:pyrimidine 5'-nucleotidase